MNTTNTLLALTVAVAVLAFLHVVTPKEAATFIQEAAESTATFIQAKPIAVGLFLDIIGVALVLVPIIMTPRQAALAEGVQKIKLSGGGSIFAQDNSRRISTMPARVKDRLKQSRWAACGVVLMISGFCLQIYGNLQD